MIYPILTINNNAPVILPDAKIDNNSLTLGAIAAASKLFARAEREKANENCEQQTYGELWKSTQKVQGSTLRCNRTQSIESCSDTEA